MSIATAFTVGTFHADLMFSQHSEVPYTQLRAQLQPSKGEMTLGQQLCGHCGSGLPVWFRAYDGVQVPQDLGAAGKMM